MQQSNRTCLKLFPLVLTVLLAEAISQHTAWAGGDWNDAKIDWQGYETGLAAAKKAQKPICLVFYTEWCPHCANYSHVFHDAEVVARSKKFVMIRVDKDKNSELSKKFAPDGEYIPRTYFLSTSGELDVGIHAPRDQYKYFYDERNPNSLLGGMDQALKKYQ